MQEYIHRYIQSCYLGNIELNILLKYSISAIKATVAADKPAAKIPTNTRYTSEMVTGLEEPIGLDVVHILCAECFFFQWVKNPVSSNRVILKWKSQNTFKLADQIKLFGTCQCCQSSVVYWR